MGLTRLYTLRMGKSLTSKRTIVTMVILIGIVVASSLTITFAPLTPPTRMSLLRLAKDMGLPTNSQFSIAIAFFAVEFPLFLALFSSVMVSLIPQRMVSFERTSGNMELLLSMFGDTSVIARSLLISSVVAATIVYGIFTIVGLSTILIFEALNSHYISFPHSFYILIFALSPSIIILAVSISLLLTVSFPAFSSVEIYALTSSPLQIVAYAPALIIILIVTLLPVTPLTIVYLIVPLAVFFAALALFLAHKTMRRDIMVRK